jgi:hypothetical protein
MHPLDPIDGGVVEQVWPVFFALLKVPRRSHVSFSDISIMPLISGIWLIGWPAGPVFLHSGACERPRHRGAARPHSIFSCG